MRYLGIDPSLSGTGVALIDSETGQVTTATIKTGSLRGGKRLNYIFTQLGELVPPSVSINSACIEGYAYGGLGKLAELAEAGGVVRLFLASREITYTVVAPAALKKYATGDSSAEKKSVIESINQKYGSAIRDDNQADALVLADIAKTLASPSNVVERPAAEVVQNLLSPKAKRRRTRIKRITKNSL